MPYPIDLDPKIIPPPVIKAMGPKVTTRVWEILQKKGIAPAREDVLEKPVKKRANPLNWADDSDEEMAEKDPEDKKGKVQKNQFYKYEKLDCLTNTMEWIDTIIPQEVADLMTLEELEVAVARLDWLQKYSNDTSIISSNTRMIPR